MKALALKGYSAVQAISCTRISIHADKYDENHIYVCPAAAVFFTDLRFTKDRHLLRD
ncbi:hypothetical protein ACQ4WY_06965 [Janthinobacterium sp. LB2P49]|uniref:hypothetical protein n=1 Tax=Janthinobacterium sp. LB2P49 TaxID=3424198 RepID=UPI003F220A8D